MTNLELALEFYNLPHNAATMLELLNEHRPEPIDSKAPEFEAIAALGVEISDHPNPVVYAAKRVYNAEYGYHHLLGKNQALGACLDEIQANSERTARLIEAGRADR